MAEKVVENLEDFLSLSESLIRGGIFNEEELKQIIAQRRSHEYFLCKRRPVKEDFLSYIKYDTALLLLMSKRIKRANFPHGDAIIKRQFEFVHYMFNNCHKRYPADLEIYDKHIYFCDQMNENFIMNQLISEMVSKNLKESGAWRMASKWCRIKKGSEMSEKLLEKAVVVVKDNVKVLDDLLSFRLGKIAKDIKYNDTERVEVMADVSQEALEACHYHWKILLCTVEYTRRLKIHLALLFRMFKIVNEANQLDITLLRIFAEDLCELRLDVDDKLMTRVTFIKSLFLQAQRLPLFSDSEKYIELLALFTHSLIRLFAKNCGNVTFDMVDESIMTFKSLYKLSKRKDLVYPYSSTIALSIMKIYLMVAGHLGMYRTAHISSICEQFCRIYKNDPAIWGFFLILETNGMELNTIDDIDRWQNLFVEAAPYLTEDDTRSIVNSLMKRLNIFHQADELDTGSTATLIRSFMPNFIPLFRKFHCKSVNYLFVAMLPLIKANGDLIRHIRTVVDIENLNVELVECLADFLIHKREYEMHNKDVPFIRRLFERMVAKPSANADCWISYIKFERRLFNKFYANPVNNSSIIYQRAIRCLNETDLDDFFVKFYRLGVSKYKFIGYDSF